jgi:hypothetical protein
MSALPQFSGYSDNPPRGPSIEEFSADLARANQFKKADIAANRNGFMSTRQFFRLLWQASKPIRQATWTLLVWVSLLTFLNMLFRSRFMRFVFFHNYAWEAITVSIGVAISFIVAILNSSERSWLLVKDLLAGEVTSVEGRLDPSWGEEMGEGFKKIKREMVPTYHYSVRQEKFEVQPQAFELLRSKYEEFRPVVRIYFTPRSRLLLSIETVVVEPSRYQPIS